MRIVLWFVDAGLWAAWLWAGCPIWRAGWARLVALMIAAQARRGIDRSADRRGRRVPGWPSRMVAGLLGSLRDPSAAEYASESGLLHHSRAAPHGSFGRQPHSLPISRLRPSPQVHLPDVAATGAPATYV
jgi:hypothetical protein